MPESSRKHPSGHDLYTPLTPEVLALLHRMRDELGSWREVAAVSGHRNRVIRRIHRGERKAVSLRLLDSLCQATGVGHVGEFLWFTADDLVALGIWDSVKYMEGRKSYDEGQHVSRAERRRKRRALARKLRKDRHAIELGHTILDEGQKDRRHLPWD